MRRAEPVASDVSESDMGAKPANSKMNRGGRLSGGQPGVGWSRNDLGRERMERDEAQAGEGEGGAVVGRRGLLTGVVLGAAALVLVGCDGGEDDDDDDDDGHRRRRRRRRR